MTGTTGESHLRRIWQDHLALGPRTLSSVAIRILNLSHHSSTLGQMVKAEVNPRSWAFCWSSGGQWCPCVSVWFQEHSFNLLGFFFPSPTSLIYIQEIRNKIMLLGKCDMDVI